MYADTVSAKQQSQEQATFWHHISMLFWLVHMLLQNKSIHAAILS